MKETYLITGDFRVFVSSTRAFLVLDGGARWAAPDGALDGALGADGAEMALTDAIPQNFRAYDPANYPETAP